MGDCIFCKIASGDIPSHTIYEDERVRAFLDINPANEGHTLIIPKKHADNIYDIDEEDLKAIIAVSKKIAIKLKEILGVENINLVQSNGKAAQQDVFHFHMHVVPRHENDGLNIWDGKEKKEPDFEELSKKLKL